MYKVISIAKISGEHTVAIWASYIRRNRLRIPNLGQPRPGLTKGDLGEIWSFWSGFQVLEDSRDLVSTSTFLRTLFKYIVMYFKPQNKRGTHRCDLGQGNLSRSGSSSAHLQRNPIVSPTGWIWTQTQFCSISAPRGSYVDSRLSESSEIIPKTHL